jgi:DNA-binding transcriptional regulator YhcF (GntR family)
MNRLTASQQAVQALARLLMEQTAGARLPTIQELNANIKVGVGTVQKAIGALRDAGAVAVRARGHKGTFIEQLDYARLWSFAASQPLRILLPFVDAPEFRGLSDGLTVAFEAIGVRTRVDHQRGATMRLQRVLERRYDACVVSELAVRRSSDASSLNAAPLHDVVYYRRGSVMVLATQMARRGKRRIGYDPNSLDHYLLTQAEFPAEDPNHVYVPCSYAHLLSALLAGVVDCGIWHRVDIGVSMDLLPVTVRAPERPATLELLTSCERAALVFRSDRADIGNIVRLTDSSGVKAAQDAEEHEEHAEDRRLRRLINANKGKREPLALPLLAKTAQPRHSAAVKRSRSDP